MTERVLGLPLTVRAIWWRRGVSSVILVVALLTVAAAAVAPTYARAAGESVLQDRLGQSPPSDVGIAFEGYVRPGDPAASLELTRGLPAAGSQVGYPTRIPSLDVVGLAQVSATAPPRPSAVFTQLLWREGACEHIVLVAGRCPTAPGEVAVTARTAATRPEWDVGTSGSLDRVGIGPQMTEVDVEVVGVYRARSQADPFWFDRGYFNARYYHGWGDGPDTVDAFLADVSTFTSLPETVEVPYAVDYPLDVAAVGLSDVPGLRATVDEWRMEAVAVNAELRTALPRVLDRTEEELRLLDLAALVVCVQLALLAGLVLFQVVADTTEARGNEIALAKLRGLRPGSTVAVALAEPLALIAAAVPLGVITAWLASSWLASAFLLPGTPVRVTAGTWAAAAAAMIGGAAASLLAARRTLTRPVLEQWAGAGPSRRRGRSLLVADLAIAFAALVGFAVLGSGTPSDTPATGLRGVAALLAPGLLVLAVALLAVRLLPLAVRVGLAPTRASRHVGTFLALRQVARRPAGLRLATLLAVALGLAVFAVGAESAAAANRESRAALELGADRVLQVAYEPGAHDPLTVTRKVDPDGRWAMAVSRWIPDGGDVMSAMLAVDAARLPTVSRWDATGTGVPAGQAAAVLAPAQASVAERPVTLPAYVAGPAAPVGSTPLIKDADGNDIPLDIAAHLPRLPVVGSDGVVVDLERLRTAARGTETESQWWVWLGADAPADAVARLTDAGLLVDQEDSASARADLLGRQGPALALRLLLACAAAGACLAAAAVAIAVAVTGRRRSFELAALRAVGVPRRSLLGACVGEQVLLLGAGLLVGIPAGLLAARLSLPLIPQFADPTATLLTFTPRIPPVLAVSIVAALAVAVVAWVAGTLVLRAAVPSRLREADR